MEKGKERQIYAGELVLVFLMDKRFSSSEIPTEWGKQSYCLVGKLFV